MYGLRMNYTLLNEFDYDMIYYRTSKPFMVFLLIFICLAFIVFSFIKFPSLFILLRENMYNCIIYCTKNFCNRNYEVQIQQNEEENKSINIETKFGVIIAILLYILIILNALLIQRLKTILVIAGAISGSFISFILPCIFYIMICKIANREESMIMPWIVLMVGLFITVLSIVLAFL